MSSGNGALYLFLGMAALNSLKLVRKDRIVKVWKSVSLISLRYVSNSDSLSKLFGNQMRQNLPHKGV